MQETSELNIAVTHGLTLGAMKIAKLIINSSIIMNEILWVLRSYYGY